MCVHIIVSSNWAAEWPPFGKELLTRLTICSLCILTICNFKGARWPSDRVSDSGARGRGSMPISAVLCPWAKHIYSPKSNDNTQEAVDPSRHDWKIVEWDVKHQHTKKHKQNL